MAKFFPQTNEVVSALGLSRDRIAATGNAATEVLPGRVTAKGTFWGGAALGLCALIAFELAEDALLPSTLALALPETDVDDGVSTLPETVDLPSSALIDDIVERPLFSPLRQPFDDASGGKALAVDADGALRGWALVGTMLVSNAPIALLRHPSDGFIQLRLGQKVAGWTISEIQPQHVRLEDGDRLVTLLVQEDKAPSQKSTAGRDRGEAEEATGNQSIISDDIVEEPSASDNE